MDRVQGHWAGPFATSSMGMLSVRPSYEHSRVRAQAGTEAGLTVASAALPHPHGSGFSKLIGGFSLWQKTAEQLLTLPMPLWLVLG